jgi:hypothetical protein
MATRFDRVTTAPSRVDEDVELSPTALAPARSSHLPSTSPLNPPAHVPRQLPVRALGGAMASWLALVFGVCYVAMPALFAIVSLNSGVIGSLSYALPAFGMASLVAIVGALVARPTIRLDTFGPRDPVLAATVGGLAVWAVVHNSSSLLQPFLQMGPLELASFVALNVVEMTLLGMMFASFTRRSGVALAMGGGFQLLVLGLTLTLMTVL